MLKLLTINLVQFYQKYLSFLLGAGKCKFHPTCSQYCVQAIKKKGIIVGLILSAYRILRCNPYSKGGDDPVK